jgi:membrane associated rhomboid family serine protease
MIERSPARAELESRLRDLVPTSPLTLDGADPKSAAAAAGAGGLVVGFLWGYLRGRRSRKKR